MSLLDVLKQKIREEMQGLDVVIGWQKGFDPLHATPLFIRKPEDVDRLIWSPLCVHNLAQFLPNFKGKKIGVVVKGCDSRSVIELLQENLIKREEVVIFGLPCTGVVDLDKIRHALVDIGRITAVETEGDAVAVTADDKTTTLPLKDVAADKCGVCQYHNAILVDHFVGDRIGPTTPAEGVYADLEAFEKMSLPERFAFWKEQMSKCIRCYACRNACPMCVCRDHCVFQSRDPHWVSQDDSVREKWMFQFAHAMHLAGRCTECGECQRACPMGIPLLIFKRHMNRSIKELFEYEAGTNPEATPPLLTYKVEEENIKEKGW